MNISDDFDVLLILPTPKRLAMLDRTDSRFKSSPSILAVDKASANNV